MYGFITVRVGSSRLKGKCLLPFGEGNTLQHVIRRARFFSLEPIICTTYLKEDMPVALIAQKENCPVYRGSTKDVLQRWLGACNTFNIDYFHYIGADDLFFDGELGKRQLEIIKRGSDIVYPPRNTYVGSCAFSMTKEIVRKACSIKVSNDTETFWPYIEMLPNVVGAELFIPDIREAKIRLTLDYEEDYWLLLTVLRILGPQATREQIEDLFIRNPDLHKVNWFRNEEYKIRQQTREREIRESLAHRL